MIDDFAGQYGFMSNFYLSPIEHEGKMWSTVEHAYQAAKTLDPELREKIRLLTWPGAAKRAGNTLALRADWEQVKFSVMQELLRKKFTIPALRKLLDETYPHALIEGNTWHDKIWGVCVCSRCGGRGQNLLGKLLVQIREEIRADAA